MPTYQYDAMDNSGCEVRDTIVADSEEQARELIRDMQLWCTTIRLLDRSTRPAPATVAVAEQPTKKKRKKKPWWMFW